MSGEAEYWTFPTNPDEFDKDERISFSRLDNKYIAVQDDGTEYEFDVDLKRWIPMIDEALIEEQRKGYFESGPDNDDAQSGSTQNRRKRSRSNEREQDSNGNSTGRSAKQARRAAKGPPQPKQNTAVYVTGLPPDATVEEVAELFSRKCGVIAEEIDSGRPRVKLYTDAEGNFKGDALIVFFKPQSVDMAIMLLDDTDFRFTPSGLSTGKMRVQAADSSYKKTNYNAPAQEGSAAAAPSGTNDRGGGADKASHKQREQDKAKIIKKTQKLDAKLADWDDDEPTPHLPPVVSKNSKWDKVVILRHMFTLEELEEDPAALLDIKEEIREECAKLGPVTNVVLFDKEEEGIVSVRFQTAEAAEACVRRNHGRSFAGRTVEAFYATGKEKFKRSKNGDEEGAGQDSDSE